MASSVAVFALKLLLAPAFVVAATLVARRHGPRLGGVFGGQPVIGGPILLVLAIVHGRAFAADAAAASLLGFVSLAAYVTTYGQLARRVSWQVALPAATAAFLACTAILTLAHPSRLTALVVALLALGAAFAVLPRPLAGVGLGRSPGAWDLPVRAACAAAVVVALTAAAGGLGAHLSGLLTPYPILTSVLVSFTHAQAGAEAALTLLRGLLVGFGAFAVFCFACAELLPEVATGWALLLGLAASTTAAVVAVAARERRRPQLAPAR